MLEQRKQGFPDFAAPIWASPAQSGFLMGDQFVRTGVSITLNLKI
jgi:hypothetical protein